MFWCHFTVLFAPFSCSFINLVKATDWPAFREIAAHAAYDIFSLCQYLIVNLFPPSKFLVWDFGSVCVRSSSFLKSLYEYCKKGDSMEFHHMYTYEGWPSKSWTVLAV